MKTSADSVSGLSGASASFGDSALSRAPSASRGVSEFPGDGTPGRRFDSVVVLGATATGKTALAVQLARLFGGEILSADSRQVYRGLDIGTGKDLAEYGEIPHHLIDIVSLPEEYNVFRYQRDFAAALAEVRARGKLPVVAGGTGLYLDSVIRGYRFAEVPENPALRRELACLDEAALLARLSRAKSARGEGVRPDDTAERDRLIRAIEIAESSAPASGFPGFLPDGGQGAGFSPLVLGIRFPRGELRERIAVRLDARLAAGMTDEVRRLHDADGIPWERLERLGLEYRHVTRHLRDGTPSDVFRQDLLTDIRRFAKRQETWFRRMERLGVSISWVERGNLSDAERLLAAAGFIRR